MAGLPRDPRQKMINVMYLVLTAILALNVSNEVISAFKVVNKSLITSNENITSGNETIYKSLEDKLNNPESKAKAEIWKPRADEAREYSKTMFDYIDSLKLELKKGADLRIKEDGSEDYREDNLDASTRLFDTKGVGKQLKDRLEQYKSEMLDIDPSIRKEFQTNFPVNTVPPLTTDGKKKTFTESFFYMTPTVAALTMLSKFQNNVKNAESMIVTYCHSQIGAVEVHMDQVGVLVGTNSTYLMPGQELKITAGVGAYSSAAAPRISINGSNVPVTNGQGTYTTKVSGSGPKSVSVNVNFTDENGKTQTKTEVIKYTVGTPGGSAVMLDKMMVCYIGVDNPVTISSGTGWDKTRVSMNGGDLKSAGAPGKYIARVTKVGKAEITVNADGKLTNVSIRVKQVPPPILMVGPSDGGQIKSVTFKNQRFARAQLNNFDFDYHYSIVSAKVYFTGANFSNLQQGEIRSGDLGPIEQFLKKCIPGTTVTFDNVKVQGPGGPVIPIPGAGFILN